MGTSLNVSMPEDLRDFIDERIERGGFSTPSEYVRHLIREDQKREVDRRLEALLLEGLDSGPPKEMTPADWAAMRETLRDQFAKRRKK